jgi:hypothetical protein
VLDIQCRKLNLVFTFYNVYRGREWSTSFYWVRTLSSDVSIKYFIKGSLGTGSNLSTLSGSVYVVYLHYRNLHQLLSTEGLSYELKTLRVVF